MFVSQGNVTLRKYCYFNRGSRSQMFFKIGVLKILQISQEGDCLVLVKLQVFKLKYSYTGVFL